MDVGGNLGPDSLNCGYPSMKNGHGCERLIAAMARRLSSASFDDLYQVGQLALLEAAKTWEPNRGVEFWTYARPSVHGEMINFLKSECRVSSAEMNLDEPDGHSSPEHEVAVRELLSTCEALLSANEREVVFRHLRDGEEFREIADSLAMTKSSVHRVFKGAITTLREHLSGDFAELMGAVNGAR